MVWQGAQEDKRRRQRGQDSAVIAPDLILALEPVQPRLKAIDTEDGPDICRYCIAFRTTMPNMLPTSVRG